MAAPTPTIRHHFGDDHDRLDGLFQRFQQLKHTDLPLARQLFAEFKAQLERHIAWEEEILFPLFEERTGFAGGGPTAVMRWEHEQIKQHLAAIELKQGQNEATTAGDEAALLAVLGPHNLKEENILYPMIDQFTTEAERRGIYARMDRLRVPRSPQHGAAQARTGNPMRHDPPDQTRL